MRLRSGLYAPAHAILNLKCAIDHAPLNIHKRVNDYTSFWFSTTRSRCQTNWNTHEEYFQFTRGRFVHDEQNQMAMRTVRFDMDELAQVAAKAISASSRCVDVRKCPDGMYNKAFVFTMDDGRQVVGKVPNPNAGIPHLTTASEVATMEYVHRVLKTPVPQVYAWSWDAQSTAVGAEYIIMEKVTGVPLAQVWDQIDGLKQSRIIMKLVEYQKSWSNASFGMYGNLYHRSHLERISIKLGSTSPVYGDVAGQPDFVVGPSCSRFWTDHKRARIECDRGETIEQYFEAVLQRETESVRRTKSFYKHPLLVTGPKIYTVSRERKLKAIEAFRQVFRYILPSDASLCAPSIWHDDLHEENIYVDPDNPENITGIIDWQSTHIAPLFEHHLRPPFLDFSGTGHSLDEPALPDVTLLPQIERKEALKKFYATLMAFVYNQLAAHHMPKVFDAIQFRTTNPRMILHFIHRVTEVGDAQLLSEIAHLRDEWGELPSIQEGGSYPHHPFPLHLTDAEFDTIEKDSEDAERGHDLMSQISQQMGALFPDKGLVEHQDYDEVKAMLRDARDDIADQLELDPDDRRIFCEQWPFD